MKVVKVIVGVGLGLSLAAALLYGYYVKPQLEFARVATAFGAKKMCSCLHVAGLDYDQCLVDFTDDVSMAEFVVQGDKVSVHVLGGRIGNQAVHTPGFGCTIVPDDVGGLAFGSS